MTTGIFVWCLIWANINTGHVEPYLTAVYGRITSIQDDTIYVDFSEYARIHLYEGNYSNIQLNVDECTK